MDAYPFTLSEVCTFLGIFKPTASSWIRSGWLVATRTDPSKSKSPYLITPQACLAALNNPIHTIAVIVVYAHEEKNMSLFRRGNVWYGNYTKPGGKCIKESLGTEDKRQAKELHDRRKAELWRIEKLGDFPNVTFEEACLRWFEEKSEKNRLILIK